MPALQKFDAIIIGAGQGGFPLALRLAEEGWNTALIERAHLGGSCINYGCTPTKTMVASAEIAYLARRAGDYGVRTGEVKVDLAQVVARKRRMVESFREGRERRINDSDVELIRGSARFSDSRTIEVELNHGGSRSLTSERIIIDTGGRPRLPEIPGIQQIHWLDSTSIMELEEIPEHLIIIGGGYIGIEFGQMFSRFGSRVTIVQRDSQLLSIEDEDIAELVAEILRDEGIEILLSSQPIQASSGRNGATDMLIENIQSGIGINISGSHLLIAAGRVPNVEDLNLRAAGVETNSRGFIAVNERLETNVEGIYALGDVKGGPAFTHISYDDFRILSTNLLEGGSASIYNRPVPYVVFIDPQLGRIGLTEKQARAQGIDFRVAKIPMNYVARALELGRSRGMMKALVDTNSDQILGCAILGFEGGETMAMIQIAMLGGLPYQRLRDGVFTHPTLSEALNTLFMSMDDN